MQFKFDPNQDFQLDAIQAVTGLFQGQVRIQAAPQFTLGPSIVSAVANRLDLPETGLLANLREVQQRNHITPDDTLKTLNGNGNGRFYNFSVEMETGTGKTYVYLRTAL
ncbi:MAG: hypothetical protein JXB38_08930, partial [Anaerolineales bacterium]|nr:hypothetical protein [Anaerolineales bacterium]